MNAPKINPFITPSMLMSLLAVFPLYAFNYIDTVALVYTCLLLLVLHQDKALFSAYLPLRMSVLIALCAALLLHKVPGFNNIEVYRNVVFSEGAISHSQFINLDKFVIALVFMPYLVVRDKALSTHKYWKRILCLSVVSIMLVFLLAYILGLAVWECKLPPEPLIFFSSMLFITVAAEECLFRGLLQKSLTDKIGAVGVVLISGIFFAAVHIGFSPLFALVSVIAGLGYGFSYYYSNNIVYPIALHFVLNTVHVVFFSYPMLLS